MNNIIKLDLGCGKNKKDIDWIGVDSLPFDGVDVVINLVEEKVKLSKSDTKYTKFKSWPWEDNSVDEVHCSHFLEHLEPNERVHFVNELYRILKPGAKCTIITPHWCSTRAYGDLTHSAFPVAEMWYYYLSSDWRAVNAPHNNFYTCNFQATWGYMHQSLHLRNQEYQNFALQNFKESAQDIIATIIKS